MKLVKLNRRYKAFKDWGHTWAFRWDGYDPKSCNVVESIMKEMYGSQYRWNEKEYRDWRATFGSPRRNGPRPYWVSFKDESVASVVLLKLQN